MKWEQSWYWKIYWFSPYFSPLGVKWPEKPCKLWVGGHLSGLSISGKKKTLRILLVPDKMFPFLQQFWLHLCSPLEPIRTPISNYLSFLESMPPICFQANWSIIPIYKIAVYQFLFPFHWHGTYLHKNDILYFNLFIWPFYSTPLQDESSMHYEYLSMPY